MELQKAKSIADGLLKDLLPFCERAEIAGSVRRKKPEVKDIEIVCIPKLYPETDMFGNQIGNLSRLEQNINALLKSWKAYCVLNGFKYKKIALTEHGIKLDLFIVTPETWGYQFAIRTGPSNYSHWLVTQKRFGGAMPAFAKIENARVLANGKLINTPEEKDLFDFLKIEMPDPEFRQAPERFTVPTK